MKYPPSSVYENPSFASETATEDELFDTLVVACLDKYYEGETVYSFNDVSPQDMKEFIGNLDVKTYGKIKEFVADLPTLYYKADYKNSKDEKKSIELTSLVDFFALA